MANYRIDLSQKSDFEFNIEIEGYSVIITEDLQTHCILGVLGILKSTSQNNTPTSHLVLVLGIKFIIQISIKRT